MDTFTRDVRYGFRMLVKSPAFTAVAIITLALGVGANTAIFSVVNSVLLRPLPYGDADRIMTIWQGKAGEGAKREDVSPPNFLDWRERASLFDHMAAIEPYGFDITGRGEPETIQSWLVTSGFFDALGVPALHGRTFLPEEYEPGNGRVVVLGYGLWQRRFGADPSIVGQKITLDRQPFTIVGVMPPEFRFPAQKEMWAPTVYAEPDDRQRSSQYIQVVARLRQGATVGQAQEEMDSIASQLAREFPRTNRETTALVVPLREQLVGHARPALLMLLGAVGLVLLIACANVANLLLVRGAARRREFAIRAALGGVRWRLIRQLLTESMLLSMTGGVVGVLLAGWGIDAILAISPENLPGIDQVRLDWRVLAFALGASALTSVIFGLVPAIHLSKSALLDSLKEGGGRTSEGSARRRLRNALVVSEIALAFVLLIGAGLLVQSFVRLTRVDPGFVIDNVAVLQVFIWDRAETPELRAVYMEQALASMKALPGVESAGAVSALPMFFDKSIDPETGFTIEGRPTSGEELKAYSTVATPDYFSTMWIPLLKGRVFDRFDTRESRPVVVISSEMARRYWPGEDPVGKKVQVRSFGRPVSREIVGIVGAARHRGLESELRPEFFIPHLQNPIGSMTFVARTTNDPAKMIPVLKSKLWELDKDLPFYVTTTMDQLVADSLGPRRFNLLLLSAFALMALGLAAVGTYGLMSFSTSQRTHEIGIRVALGAEARDIVKMVLREAVALSLSGVAVGAAGALLLTQSLRSFLFEIAPTDTVTFAGISILLIAVSIIASYIPARRAARVDPCVALRYE